MTNAFTSSGLFGDMFRDDRIAALFSAASFLKHATAFEIAWTETLMSLGAVSQQDGTRALAAMRTAAPDLITLSAYSDRDGLPVPGFVAQLRKGLDDGASAAIHTGSTSQDVIDTAMVLVLLDVLTECETRLRAVTTGLERLEQSASGPMMGRTRMQAALPVPVKTRIENWCLPLRDHLDRIHGLRTQIGYVQLGGPVGLRDAPDGKGEAAARDMAQRLGLRAGPVWHSNRTIMHDLGHWFVGVSGSLGKMGQDVTLMAQQGVDDIKLDGGGSSSAMPHKQNPVLAETLVTLARFVGVQQAAMAQTLLHEQERSGVAWALEWMVLPAMAEATGAALRHALTMLEKIERIGPQDSA